MVTSRALAVSVRDDCGSQLLAGPSLLLGNILAADGDGVAVLVLSDVSTDVVRCLRRSRMLVTTVLTALVMRR